MVEKHIPEIDVKELHRKLKSEEQFVLLDVREPWELQRSSISDGRMAAAPMSQLAQRGPNALPESVHGYTGNIYVLCHHGVRSARVTGWLVQQGWQNVFSVRGGIAAYAEEIDGSVGTY